MTEPSLSLRDAIRPVLTMQLANLGLCAALCIAAFVLRHSFLPVVWIRVIAILVVAVLMLFFGWQMSRGRRWAYVRAKWMAIGGTIGFVAIALLPGPYPDWMRIEQGVQALLFVVLAWLLTRAPIRGFFAKALPAKTTAAA